jgi:hypothetical protein
MYMSITPDFIELCTFRDKTRIQTHSGLPGMCSFYPLHARNEQQKSDNSQFFTLQLQICCCKAIHTILHILLNIHNIEKCFR